MTPKGSAGRRGLLLAIAVALPLSPVPGAFQTTGSISGIVLDDRDQPIAGAAINLFGANGAQVSSAGSDATGRFEMHGVRPETFSLTAWKAGYVNQRRAQYSRVPLRSAERRSVTVRLLRGAVIAGVVRDEDGALMARAQVHAVPCVVADGVRRFDFERSQSAETNSRGAYRVFALAPGSYVVTAGSEFNSLLEVTDPRRPDSTPRLLQGVPSFYPDSLSVDGADLVDVVAGQVRSDIDFRLHRADAGRVGATILNPTPARLGRVVVSVNDELWGSREIESALVKIAGQDAALGQIALTTGLHTLFVRAELAYSSEDPRESGELWATVPISVGAAASMVTVTLETGAALSGRFVFAGLPTTNEPRPLAFVLVPTVPRRRDGGDVYAPIGGDARFRLASVEPGSYRVDVKAPSGWTLASVLAAGRDFSDVPLDLASGQVLGDVVVTLTNQGPLLSGTVRDETGRSTMDATVIVAPADRSLWRAGSRRVRAAGVDADGHYEIRGLPSGEYVVAAVRDDVATEDLAPATLERLLRSSTRATLATGRTTLLNLSR